MNNVQLLGNLVRDVELRYTQSGSSVATFTVAATSTYKGQNGEAKELTAFVNSVLMWRISSILWTIGIIYLKFMKSSNMTLKFEFWSVFEP